MSAEGLPQSINDFVVRVQRAASARRGVCVEVLPRRPVIVLTSDLRTVEIDLSGGDMFLLSADDQWLLAYFDPVFGRDRDVSPDLVAAAFAYFDGTYEHIPARFVFGEQLRMTIGDEQLVWRRTKGSRRS